MLHYSCGVDVYHCVTLWTASDKRQSRGPKSLVWLVSDCLSLVTRARVRHFGNAFYCIALSWEAVLLDVHVSFNVGWFGRAYLYVFILLKSQACNLFALQVTLLSLSLWIITRTEKVGVKQVCGY